MAERRSSSGNEVSLFPFLSILACLIGALVLIIVVLVLAQADKAGGRTREELQRAQEFVRLERELQQRVKDDAVVKKKLEELQKLQKDLQEQQQRFLQFRKLVTSSKEVQRQNQQIADDLKKQLDDLLLEIEGIIKQQAETRAEVAKLMEEIKNRGIKSKEVPPVVVQPGGSGLPEGTRVFFVECSSGALRILEAWDKQESYRLAANPSVVVADVAYNHLLSQLAADSKSLLLFLVRDDGQGAFINGAGRAGEWGARFGKLPIPGRGELDLQYFAKLRGKVPPPPPPTSPPPAPPVKPST